MLNNLLEEDIKILHHEQIILRNVTLYSEKVFNTSEPVYNINYYIENNINFDNNCNDKEFWSKITYDNMFKYINDKNEQPCIHYAILVKRFVTDVDGLYKFLDDCVKNIANDYNKQNSIYYILYYYINSATELTYFDTKYIDMIENTTIKNHIIMLYFKHYSKFFTNCDEKIYNFVIKYNDCLTMSNYSFVDDYIKIIINKDGYDKYVIEYLNNIKIDQTYPSRTTLIVYSDIYNIYINNCLNKNKIIKKSILNTIFDKTQTAIRLQNVYTYEKMLKLLYLVEIDIFNPYFIIGIITNKRLLPFIVNYCKNNNCVKQLIDTVIKYKDEINNIHLLKYDTILQHI